MQFHRTFARSALVLIPALAMTAMACKRKMQEPGDRPDNPNALTASYCGDGRVDQQMGEECDDDEYENGDGCNENCEIESGWECDTPYDPADPKFYENPSSCWPQLCGDGLLNDTSQMVSVAVDTKAVPENKPAAPPAKHSNVFPLRKWPWFPVMILLALGLLSATIRVQMLRGTVACYLRC